MQPNLGIHRSEQQFRKRLVILTLALVGKVRATIDFTIHL